MLAAHEHGSRGGKSFDDADRIGADAVRQSDVAEPPDQSVAPTRPAWRRRTPALMGAQAVRLVACSGSKPMTPPSSIARAISPTMKSSLLTTVPPLLKAAVRKASVIF